MMNEIFFKEQQVIDKAEELLQKNQFATEEDKTNYTDLYNDYRVLFKQTKSLIKLSDLMQKALKKVSEELIRLSQIDALTGLYNKSFFNEFYEMEWKKAIQLNGTLSLIMIDIDYFKAYNDTYGHLQGDECLKAVAAEIQASVKRPKELAARFGGEEFVVLLPETDIDHAADLAYRMVNQIERLSVPHESSSINHVVTISIGVSSIVPKEGDSMDILLSRADSALYEAKEAGRNCFRKNIDSECWK